jgi:hypothetical protein
VRLRVPESILLAAALSRCDVPAPPQDSGGLGTLTDSAQAGVGSACTRGFVSIQTDYQSSSVAVLDARGNVLSPRLISSATRPPGLSAALSGDVVAPSSGALGRELVLIDRYPAAVLTWVNLETASVRAQLNVSTGFASNPHDYLQISANKAYVTRFEPNLQTGRMPFDGGNDVLIVDPSLPAITGSIDLSSAITVPGYLPRADRLLAVGRWLVVVLGASSADFTASTDAALVVIDTERDSVQSVSVLEGVHGCSSLALAPNNQELAVSCAGTWGGSSVPDNRTSAVVRLQLDRERGELQILQIHRAPDFTEGAFSAALNYASDTQLLVGTFGQFALGSAPERDDTLLSLEFDADESFDANQSAVLLRSSGEPFTLGDVRCSCGSCLVSDAGMNVVHRFVVDGGVLRAAEPIRVDPENLQLPPRYLGAF